MGTTRWRISQTLKAKEPIVPVEVWRLCNGVVIREAVPTSGPYHRVAQSTLFRTPASALRQPPIILPYVKSAHAYRTSRGARSIAPWGSSSLTSATAAWPIVSYFNNAVINRHRLRYNFAAKTEWSPELRDHPVVTEP